MISVCIFSVLFFCIFTLGMIKAIKAKNWLQACALLLFLPFTVFMFISALLGGSALNDAANDYEFYQAGHYYLCNHGRWTEVSYGQYLVVMIAEIVGFSCFAPAFILGYVDHMKEEKTKPKLLNNSPTAWDTLDAQLKQRKSDKLRK